MQILRETIGLKAALAGLRADGKTVALVPTMGALHEGHLTLVARAREGADAVVATIFVNPTQFNDPKDLERYPRSEEADAAALAAAGCDLLWMPGVADIYPAGFATTVSVAGVSERWEGAHRPGHFDGVATIVAKLFATVRPDVALFGEKDWQQLAVIRRMGADLDFGIDIRGVETVREADGLAKSSRNQLLSPAECAAASLLPTVMAEAADAIRDGEPAAAKLEEARRLLGEGGFGPVDYLALVDGDSLEPLDTPCPGARLIAAAYLGKTRLIDNICVIPDTVSGTWSPPR